MTLQELLDRCKCGVYLTVNQHRDYHETAEGYLLEQVERGNMQAADISEETHAEMIRTNSVVELQFYPTTPVGFYRIWGPTLDHVLAEAEKCFKK